MSYRRAMDIEDLWPGEMKGVVLGTRPVLLINLEGTVHAYENRCAHQGIELSRGRLRCGTLTCPAHEWTYDARTGAGLNPSGVALRRLGVRVEGTDILVDTGDGAGT
jgi:toluene monooxygenase system ferredoxin subunit